MVFTIQTTCHTVPLKVSWSSKRNKTECTSIVNTAISLDPLCQSAWNISELNVFIQPVSWPWNNRMGLHQITKWQNQPGNKVLSLSFRLTNVFNIQNECFRVVAETSMFCSLALHSTFYFPSTNQKLVLRFIKRTKNAKNAVGNYLQCTSTSYGWTHFILRIKKNN